MSKARIVDEPVRLLEELAAAGDEWRRTIWSELNTLGVFDDAYMADGWDAFCHNNIIYWRRDEDDEDGGRWTFDPRPIEFLTENPPDEDCAAVLALFEYSHGLEENVGPWMLFQYIVGIAATTQGIGLSPLMGITERDASYLGPAITAYGNSASIVQSYVELLLSFYEGDVLA
jgi:hypothetical protein